MRTMTWLLGLAWLTSGGIAAAHEGHEHPTTSAKLTGEVVDITCLMDHDSRGDQHAACAQKCIAKGLPVGLLVGHKLYAVILSSHESPNETLAPFAGKLVTMTGTVVEKDGMRVIDMATVEPATTSERSSTPRRSSPANE